MKPILEVANLWKQYHRGAQQENYLSLRNSLLKSLNPKAKKESFWALQDINFEVNPGDSLAIIGKNGAGKSTLLKILSKITPPTKGEIILRGRLASLLEVGTGFHPELTGRENIYLNGSILGLGRQEINRQFDAIVDFSGVEAFLDTPLKHYSSGMQLRLAFAVAAHLEPEILVIDEVLAVGDSVFQQKCIDKMSEVSQSGRTILFVSHNLQSVKNLCSKGILLENGSVTASGNIEHIIEQYAKDKIKLGDQLNIESFHPRQGKGSLRFTKILFPNPQIEHNDIIRLGFSLSSEEERIFKDLELSIALQDSLNNTVVHISNKYINVQIERHTDTNVYWFTLKNQLKQGSYSLTIFARANDEIEDWLSGVASIKVSEGNVYGYANSKEIAGIYQPDFDFLITTNE